MTKQPIFEIKNSTLTVQWPRTYLKSNALAGSIAKWQFIVDYLKAGGQPKIDYGGKDTCALCQRYNYTGSYCKGCPVEMIIGKPFCRNTPYEAFDLTNSLEDAQAELTFLQSLVVTK